MSTNLNAPAATTVQNTAVVELSDTGSVQVFNNSGSLTVALVVQGYFVDDGPSTTGGFVALNPVRLLDTRTTAKIPAGGSLDLRIAGVSGLPADAKSVFVNLVVEKPTGSGGAGIFKKGVAPTGAGPVFFAGASTAQTINVAPDANGFATVQNFSTTVAIDVLVDVQGYFTGTAATGNPFTPVVTRIYDSRGTTEGPVPAGGVRTVQVSGVGGLPPAGIGAAMANVIVVAPPSQGGIKVWDPDEPEPKVNNVFFPAAVNHSTLLATKVSADGRVSIANRGGQALQIVIDIQGWFSGASLAPVSEGGEYRPLQPARIVDTRNGTGGFLGTLGPDTARSFRVTGVGGVPTTGVSAVALTVTATEPSANSWLTVWPTGESRPDVSQISTTAGFMVANTVIAKVGAGGQVDVFNKTGAVNVIVDVQGYFTDSTVSTGGGTFVPLDPSRVYDTRSGVGGSTTPLSGGETRDVQVSGVGGVPASGVSAVAVNVIVTGPTTASAVQLFPSGTTRPGVSSLQTSSGRNMAALVQVKLGTGGKVSVFANSGEMDLIVDVQGYYLDNTQNGRDLYVPINPERIYRSTTDMTSGSVRAVSVAGAKTAGGDVVVPATGVTAVVLSVTAVQPGATGFMTVWPAGKARPGTSTLNYAPSDASITGTVIAKLGTNGQVNVYVNGGSPGLTVDVQGYYQASKLPPVVLSTPNLIHATGPDLAWTAYDDASPDDFDDIVEYQVHRSATGNFSPSEATLVALVDKNTTSYTDTTATPTPADDPNPTGAAYYYMVVVKTKDGRLTTSNPMQVRLPKAGRLIRVLQGPEVSSDTTLTAGQPTTSHDALDAQTQFMVGNDSATYGASRAVLKFDVSQVPRTAVVTDSELSLWTVGASDPAGATYEVHKLTKTFVQGEATWKRASAATAWLNEGGDFEPVAVSSRTGVAEQVPSWQAWDVADAVRGWQAAPTSNQGLLLKLANEASPTEGVRFMSAEASGPSATLRPRLAVTYLEKTAESTYFAPYTPARMVPGDTYPVDVTVSNTTASTLPSADWALSYRWTLPDGSDATKAGSPLQTALPKNLVSGDTVTVKAQLKAPINSESGNKRDDYVLKWELFNKVTGEWLSEAAQIPSLDQSVVVEDPTSNQLGLEKFYSYVGKNTGAGSAVMTNTFAGNTVWSYDAFSNPSRGISTFVRLAYNSLDTSDTVAGYGWSLQASSLTRLGTPLDFHPNPNPTEVTLTDGDGTSHTFSLDAAANEWKSPAGVHLFLQRLVTCDNKTEESRAWVMTRPDRTRFFFDCDGYLSAIADNNDNELTFTYEQRQSNNQPTKFLKRLTDAQGRDTLTLDYYAKGDKEYEWIDDAGVEQSGSNLTNPHIIDHLKQLTDISGRTITFTYTDKGLMAKMVDGAGSSLEKTFRFDYDAGQGNKNVKLVKVTDPRVHDTELAYYSTPEDDPKFHWFAKTITDRLDGVTTFTYTDPDGQASAAIQTQVKDAEEHTSTFVTDSFGRPAQTTNAKAQTTKVHWDADNNVDRLEEDGGAVTTWEYDAKTGYPTLIKDAEANKNGTLGTAFKYDSSLLDGYIADLETKTSPEGRKWAFTYTPSGDLQTVTDPAGTATTTVDDDYVTTYAYDGFG
ncbi:DNRLRE domain-containing protein [Actinopolymorpha pittospori]